MTDPADVHLLRAAGVLELLHGSRADRLPVRPYPPRPEEERP